MIEQDASTVRDRQETDSIAVVDDIRSHIRCCDGDTGVGQGWLKVCCRSRVRTMSDMTEAEWKMSLVDNLLSQLDMEA